LNNLRNSVILITIILVSIIFFTYISSFKTVTPEEVSFMKDFRQVDDYPLFVAQYTADYNLNTYLETGERPNLSSIGCTCFTKNLIVGRNFDFPDNPALLLYTSPDDGYKSLSMVDLGYFGYSMSNQPIDPTGLEQTPYMPFDGMNEKGLVVTMAAVPNADPPSDNENSVGEIGVIRVLLDHASNLDEAVEILSSYNILIADPPIHYLITDASGDSVIVEFVDGEMKLYRSSEYNIITNFVLTGLDLPGESHCDRYNSVYSELTGNEMSSSDNAFNLLEGSSQSNTIWSCVYDIDSLTVQIVMGRNYETSYTFTLDN
jgi:predicted choloylglycine hydrolase